MPANPMVWWLGQSQTAGFDNSTTSSKESNNRHQPNYSQSRKYYGECRRDSSTLDNCLGLVSSYIAWAATSPCTRISPNWARLYANARIQAWGYPQNGKRYSPKYLLTDGPKEIIIQPNQQNLPEANLCDLTSQLFS